MSKATLINDTGEKQVVESGSQEAQQLFGQGYSLMGAPAITAESLKPTAPIELPKINDTTNYQGIINGGAAFSDALAKSQAESLKLLQENLNKSQAPINPEDIFNQLYGDLGIQQKSEDVTAKESAVQSAQKQLDLLNAQAQGLYAEAQGVPIQIQQESLGRGVTAGGVAPLETGRLREIALRSLPLQAQTLAAQAQVSSAQGDVATAQKTLALASERLNTAFAMKSEYAKQLYDYNKDLRDKVYDFATAKEKTKLEALQREDDKQYELTKTNLSLQNEWAKQALANGQSELIQEINSIDPNDPNFQEKLGAIQAKINVEKKEDTQLIEANGRRLLINAQTGETIKDLGSATKPPSISEQISAQDAGYTIDENGNVIKTGNINIPETSRLAYVNNNPGNLRFVGQAGATEGQGGFARFNTPEEGYEALKKQIELDKSRNLTVEQFINKYAPPVENDTSTYINQFNDTLGTTNNSLISNINTDQIAQFMANKESGTKIGSEESTFDKFAQEQIALAVLPVQVKNSEMELKRALEGINAGLAQGLTPYEIADNLMGYKVDNPDDFSNTIRGYISQSANINPNDPAEYARLINSGNKTGVVRKIENSIQQGTDTQARETTARYTYDLAPQIYKEITAMENKFGLVEGNWNKLKKKVTASEDFQKVSSELTAYVQEWRRQMSGTATTPTELKMIDELLPSVTDNPINLKQKIRTFAEMQLNILNSNRGSLNLPKLDINSLLDYNSRVGLYENNEDPLGIK